MKFKLRLSALGMWEDENREQRRQEQSSPRGNGTLTRVTAFATTTGQPTAQYVYAVNAIPKAPVPTGGFADNGLTELLAVPEPATFVLLGAALLICSYSLRRWR